jgi:hypothetical protein
MIEHHVAVEIAAKRDLGADGERIHAERGRAHDEEHPAGALRYGDRRAQRSWPPAVAASLHRP